MFLHGRDALYFSTALQAFRPNIVVLAKVEYYFTDRLAHKCHLNYPNFEDEFPFDTGIGLGLPYPHCLDPKKEYLRYVV